MPKNRKYYPHNAVLFITSRIEEGLPLVPTHYLNFIIWGILAKGRSMYRVKICHFCFMANHFHMLVVVDDPENVSAFMGYIKGEISHAVNRLLGRLKKTIWCEGYDSPILLSAVDVLKYIRYIYLNPARAHLVERINQYPGVSSWDMFVSDNCLKTFKKLHRTNIRKLSVPTLSIREQKDLVNRFKKANLPEFQLILEPFAWMDCFEEHKLRTPADIKAQLIRDIHEEEQYLINQRSLKQKQVMGPTELRRQSLLKVHTPKTFSKKMICICSDLDLRKEFIKHFKMLCDKARKVYEAWQRGDLRQKIPPGLFSPKLPTLASQLSVWN